MSEQPIPPISSPSNPSHGSASSRPPESSGQAIASLVLGILSLTCFGLLTGIPAIILGKGAARKIKESAGALTGSGLAQAGVITGWVGTILTLVAMAVYLGLPLLTARTSAKTQESYTRTCINNLRQIDVAKQMWAIDNKARANDMPTWENIRPFLARDTSGALPQCPAGGSYFLNDLQTVPQCTIPGHKID